MVILNSVNFLKAQDVKRGDTIKFLNEGAWKESDKFKYLDGTWKKDFTLNVMHSGKEKVFRLNKTNRDMLIKMFGNDTAEWIGKDVVLTIQQALVNGKMTPIIMIGEIDEACDAN